MSWANRDSGREQTLYSKLFYNKGSIIVDEFFSFLSFFGPRYYFQSGDGTIFSPGKVEPIPVLLFPFWLMGLSMFIKNKRVGIVLLYILLVFIVFLLGKFELPFVWPVIVFNIYLSYFALKNVKFSGKTLATAVIIIYALYINCRLLIL